MPGACDAYGCIRALRQHHLACVQNAGKKKPKRQNRLIIKVRQYPSKRSRPIGANANAMEFRCFQDYFGCVSDASDLALKQGMSHRGVAASVSVGWVTGHVKMPPRENAKPVGFSVGVWHSKDGDAIVVDVQLFEVTRITWMYNDV